MKWLYGIILVALVGIGVCGGVWYEQSNEIPKIIKEAHYGTVQVIVIPPPPPEIRETVRVVYKDRYVYRPTRRFETPGEFLDWVKPKLVTFLPGDCDDYAEWLHRRATEDGYLLSTALIMGGMYHGVQVSEFGNAHMGNQFMTQTDIYYFEPQSDGARVIKICPRD